MITTRQLDEDTAISAALLSDDALNVLIDRHVFLQPTCCQGRFVYCWKERYSSVYRCEDCGCVASHVLGDAVSSLTGHKRMVPNYVGSVALAWQIIEEIRDYHDMTTKICFILALRALCPKRNVFALSGRIIALAALQAMNIVDECGYVVAPGVRQG